MFVTVSSSKLEQDRSFLISDQAYTLNLSFSGCSTFSHITDKVAIFSQSSSYQLSNTESLNPNLSEMGLIFDLNVCSHRDHLPSIHFACISDFALTLEFTPMCVLIPFAALSKRPSLNFFHLPLSFLALLAFLGNYENSIVLSR